MFTQTKWDEEGYPIRDLDSTTYTGAIETAEDFGKRIYLEAWKRGWSRAEKKVVMGDGAECANARKRGFGILPNNTSRERSRSSICITLANICGSWRARYIPMKKGTRKPG